MSTNPPSPPSDLDIFLGNRIRCNRPVLKRLLNESSYAYFMRWALMHSIRVEFVTVDLSENVSINPIMCTPVRKDYSLSALVDASD